jgi:hypothetical protein
MGFSLVIFPLCFLFSLGGAYDTSRSEWETVILLSVGGGAFWDIAGIIPSQGSVTKLGIDRIIDFSHLISHIGILE